MNAMYFYNRLVNYEQEVKETGKYYYGYSNRNIDIHRKGEDSKYYTIYSDKSVYEEYLDDYIRKEISLEDLTGDNFELYSKVQFFKSGYLVLENINTEIEVKKIISELHKYIGLFDDNNWFSLEKKTNIPLLCGGSFWSNGLTDDFSYYAVNGIELNIRTIRMLCKENIYRKHYDAKCIPFIKSMDNNKCIHISFTHIVSGTDPDHKETYEKCNEALSDLLSYMKELNVDCKFVECKMIKPVYY